MKRYYQQSSRFQATPAQIEYLRCLHKGIAHNTNWATRNRCHRFLIFTNKTVTVKPEIVAQFGLDKPLK